MKAQFHFDLEEAIIYGLNEAIILHQMRNILDSKDPKFVREFGGQLWIRRSVESWKDLFVFWTRYHIEKALKRMEKQGLIMVGSFHGDIKDVTNWYSLPTTKCQSEPIKEGL